MVVFLAVIYDLIEAREAEDDFVASLANVSKEGVAMKKLPLTDENDKPRRLFNQRVEWPLVLLFGTIPTLAIVAIVKNVLLAGGA